MSNQNIPTEKQASEAGEWIMENLHVPAFFEKLAANGIQPRNAAEAQQLLSMGAVLAAKAQESQEKDASDTGNPFLDSCLQELGQQPSQSVEQYVKSNADALVKDSELAKKAALIFAHVAAGGETQEPAENTD